MNKVLSYWLYAIFFGAIVIWGSNEGQTLSIEFSQTFSPYSLYLFMAFYPIFIGFLLGFPKLISHFRRAGKWKVDWHRILGLALPTFLLNITALLSVTPVSKYFIGWSKFVLDKQVLTISGIVCGYVLASSFIEVKEEGK